MKGDSRFGWYFAVHSLFAAAMLLLVLSDNLLLLYFAWELEGLGSYLLIGFWYEKKSAAEAAKKAFVTTRIGDVGLLIGIIILFKASGTFDISSIIHVAQEGGISNDVIFWSSLLIFFTCLVARCNGRPYSSFSIDSCSHYGCSWDLFSRKNVSFI